jgi:hypothetical protein
LKLAARVRGGRIALVNRLLVCLLLTPTLGWAQQVELGVQGGYFLPAVQLFERTVAVSGPSGYASAHFDARHDPGVMLGVDVAVWPLSHLGVDLAGTVGLCNRSGSALDQSAVLSTLGVRLVGRKQIGGMTLRLGAGPALLHMGGSAYGGPTTLMSLAKRTLGGATLQGDVTQTIGVFRLRLAVEDALYRVTMSPLTAGTETTRTPLQHDVGFTAGVSLPLR